MAFQLGDGIAVIEAERRSLVTYVASDLRCVQQRFNNDISYSSFVLNKVVMTL